MKCSKCGNELKKDDLFCTKCGKKVEQEIREDKTERSLNSNEKEKEKEKQKSKKWKIIVPILIILIIIIVVGIVIFKKSADNVNEENSQEVSNIINTDQSVNEDILTVVSKEKVNTERGFINLCTQYGEYIEIPSSLYKENNNCFVVSIRVDVSKIDEVYEELSNNEQVLKVENGFINPKEIELYTGYEMLVYQLINDEEERNGFGIYYAMVDINNDGTNELALIHGKSRADAITEFYTYQNNSEAVKIGEGAQGEIYKVNNENKLKLVYTGTGGSQTIWDISYDNNNFEIKENSTNTDLENIGEEVELENAEETYGYYISSDDNQNNETSEFSDEIIHERFENSYNLLVNEIDSFNITLETSNQNNKILQTPITGKIYALFSKEKNEIVYMQYYGQQSGTEIIWIDREVESSSSKFEGNYGATMMKPYIIRAININGQVLNQSDSSVDFSVFSALIGLIEKQETDEAKEVANSYELKEFEWSINTNGEILLKKI